MSKLYIEREVVEFLLGSAPLDGVWFGEKHPTERGMYWWRKYLQDALSAAVEPVKQKCGPECDRICQQPSGYGDCRKINRPAPAVPDAAKPLTDEQVERMVDAYTKYQSPVDRGYAQQEEGMRLALVAGGFVPEGTEIVEAANHFPSQQEGFKPLDPPRYSYVDVESISKE